MVNPAIPRKVSVKKRKLTPFNNVTAPLARKIICKFIITPFFSFWFYYNYGIYDLIINYSTNKKAPVRRPFFYSYIIKILPNIPSIKGITFCISKTNII
jgi:hypothetical protein